MQMVAASVLVVTALVTAGCGELMKSKEEQLLDLKRDNRAALNALYTSYGGGQLASEMKKESDKGAADVRRQGGEGSDGAVALLQMFGNAATEIDRVAFEEQCLMLGRGEQPAILNDKAKQFFRGGDVVNACEKIATRDLKIHTLERELGVPQQQY